ncbi:MAG: extracellular solute-binding protein [Pseudomonadota bacterium]
MLKTLLTTATAAVFSATTVFAGGHSDLSSMTWDEIVAQAKEEGELTWYVWYLTDDLRRFATAFEEEYGIEVTIPEGTASGNADKLLAERGRDTGDIDVFAWGWDNFSTVDMSDLFLSLDMLPEDSGRVEELVGISGEGYAVAYWGNQTGIAYDPAKVDEANLPQTPDDFAAFWAANPEKFGFNYEKGGSGPSFWQNITRTLTDWDVTDGNSNDERLAAMQPAFDFFNEHAENYLITASNADSIIRVSDGELIMVPAWEDHLAGLQKRGEVRTEIKFYIPEMGMNGGGNGVAIPRNAPHSAAAAVFVDWLTSAETQSVLNRDFGTAPMHAEADDSFALVPNAQRAYRSIWAAKPFRDEVNDAFIDHVIFER